MSPNAAAKSHSFSPGISHEVNLEIPFLIAGSFADLPAGGWPLVKKCHPAAGGLGVNDCMQVPIRLHNYYLHISRRMLMGNM